MTEEKNIHIKTLILVVGGISESLGKEIDNWKKLVMAGAIDATAVINMIKHKVDEVLDDEPGVSRQLVKLNDFLCSMASVACYVDSNNKNMTTTRLIENWMSELNNLDKSFAKNTSELFNQKTIRALEELCSGIEDRMKLIRHAGLI